MSSKAKGREHSPTILTGFPCLGRGGPEVRELSTWYNSAYPKKKRPRRLNKVKQFSFPERGVQWGEI